MVNVVWELDRKLGYKDELYVRFLIICVQIKKAVER